MTCAYVCDQDGRYDRDPCRYITKYQQVPSRRAEHVPQLCNQPRSTLGGLLEKKDDEDDNNDDDGTKRPYHACSAGRESSWLSCNCSRLVPSSLIPFASLRPTGLLPESSKHWANTRTTTTHTARAYDSTLSMATGKSMKRPYRERVPPACVLVKGCVFHSKQFFPILSFSIFHSSETCRRPSHFLQGL